MLLHPTLEKLKTMRFSGMAEALESQMQMDGLNDVGFEKHLGLLLDHEQAVRETRKMNTRLRKQSKDKLTASLRSDTGVRNQWARCPDLVEYTPFSTTLQRPGLARMENCRTTLQIHIGCFGKRETSGGRMECRRNLLYSANLYERRQRQGISCAAEIMDKEHR